MMYFNEKQWPSPSILWMVAILFLMTQTVNVFAKSISPYDYGLGQAKNGEERYWAIYNAHLAALNQNALVDYSNIKALQIEIPSNARSIPLNEQTDFCGLTLTVDNNTRDRFCLFTMVKKEKEIIIDKKHFVSMNLSAYRELASGVKILVVEDKTPWVVNRKGFDYGAVRRDVVLLKNGKAMNSTIQSYNNDISQPSFKVIESSDNIKFFKGITFIRTSESTKKTFLLKVQGYNNLEINDVSIITPGNPNNWYTDSVISIENCTNLTIKNVVVDGTYSLPNQYGYAFALNNIWNVVVQKMRGYSLWGVFGCSNINTATIIDSDLDRFDLHCYGRDYTFKNTIIRGSMPLASMFGKVIYVGCTFNTAHPCLYRADYNAYTPFDLSFNRCKFIMDKDHNCIVYLTILSEDKNSRPELNQKCLPNIDIRNCDIYPNDDVTSWDIIHMMRNLYPEPFGHITTISVNGLKVHNSNAPMSLLTPIKQDVNTEHPLTIFLKNIRYEGITNHPDIGVNINRNAPDRNLMRIRRVRMKVKKES